MSNFIFKTLFLFPLLLSVSITIAYANNDLSAQNEEKVSFWDQRNRGFIWFDHNKQKEEETNQEMQSKMPTLEMMEQAEQENKQFSRELELLKQLVVRYPENIEYVVLYKRKEKEMQDRAEKLGQSWAMANFLNPDIVDTLANPQNMYGRSIQKEELRKEEEIKINKLSRLADLFIFRQDECPYCETLEKSLQKFALKYGFNVEAISPDNTKSKYFETNSGPEIIKALQLEVMPTVVAVVKDTRERFEIARGAVSIYELERSCLLLEKLISSSYKSEVSK